MRVPDGVCLTIGTASVDRKNVSSYLTQQGSIGVSLRISSEENPQLLPIWTFDKDRSNSYSASDLGIRVCGPRNNSATRVHGDGDAQQRRSGYSVFGSVWRVPRWG